MRFGSLFTGIGGFDLGLERVGMECAWQVEIDTFPRRILEWHWPSLHRPEDVCEVGSDNLGAADLICGGFPCQDLSVAGKRAGLAGERSGLFYEFARIIDELAPRWVLIENVPGLLSSNGGRDMGAVLGTLAELGYGYAYRVLDAQFFGVAQRRRRVFIVGCFGDATSAAKVLFEPESCPRGTPPSRKKRRVSATLSASGAGTSRTGGQAAEPDFLVPQLAGTLKARDYKGANSEDAAGGKLVVSHIAAFIPGQGAKAGSINAENARDGQLVAGVSTNKQDASHETYIPVDRIGGWVDREDRVFAFQSDKRRSTVQEHVYHKPAGRADTLTQQRQNVLLAPTLSTKNEVASSSTQRQAWMEQAAELFGTVRRLTPLECERLQGFPDGWTAIDGENTPDAPRYKALGNAVCVNVAEWIGRRIVMVEG